MYMPLISPVVLYCSETWPPGKTKEIRLGVFKKKILERISGACKDAQTGVRRMGCNREFQDFFQSPNVKGHSFLR